MGAYSGTVPTFLAGELPDADKFIEISNFMTAATAAWTSYTPTWTASAGTPAVGNGSLTGAYRRIGKTVDFRMLLTAGSTTTYGTAGAYWAFGMPALGNCNGLYVFAVRLLDNGFKEYMAVGAASNGGAFDMYQAGAGGTGYGRLLNNSPFTFGNTDQLWANGTYELA